jgi:glucose-6-phosphate isomerase
MVLLTREPTIVVELSHHFRRRHAGADESDRRTWTEPMTPGSVHHVPPGTAHRVADIGDVPLVFVSYWPSETGHDYRAIVEHGFGARVRRVNGRPELVPEA